MCAFICRHTIRQVCSVRMYRLKYISVFLLEDLMF